MTSQDAWVHQMLVAEGNRLQAALGESGWHVDPEPGLGPGGSVFLLTRGDDGVILSVSHDRTAVVVTSALEELQGQPITVGWDRLNPVTSEWLRCATECVEAVAAAWAYDRPIRYVPCTPTAHGVRFGLER